MVKRASWLSCRSHARVIANHHNLLLGVPGRGAQRTETDRQRLTQLLATTHEDQL